MRKMKAVQVSRAGGDLEVVERDIPETGPGQVRIRVQACGVCHSDVFTKEGLFPGISYPRVPGHEVAGIVDAVGPGVKGWTKGDRVGVGWHGGQDGTCTACRKGDFANCANVLICGLSYDGGYQEYMIAPVEALARMPESLDPAEAAPLMGAGITTFNARGTQNAAIAQKLGADLYIDSAATDAAAELQKLGGASVVLATAPSGKAMSSLLPGLTANGTFVVVGASQDPLCKIVYDQMN